MARFNIFKAISSTSNRPGSSKTYSGDPHPKPETYAVKPKGILLNGSTAVLPVPIAHSQPSPVVSPLYDGSFNFSNAYSHSEQTPFRNSNPLYSEPEQSQHPVPGVQRSTSEWTRYHYEDESQRDSRRAHKGSPLEYPPEPSRQRVYEDATRSRNAHDNGSTRRPSEFTRTGGYTPWPRDKAPIPQPSIRHRNTTAARSAVHHRYTHYPETIEPVLYEHDPWTNSDFLEPEVYHYIIPSGVEVVFKDEDGNEITRIGRSHEAYGYRESKRAVPIVVEDELGHELFRTPSWENSSHTDSSYRRRSGDSPRERRPIERTPTASAYQLPEQRRHRPHVNSTSRSARYIRIDNQGREIPM